MKTTKNNGYSIYNKVLSAKASKKNFDLIVLVRNGNFYEAYEEDADQLSGILGIGQYNKKGCLLNIAGFSTELLTENLSKMIKAGREVAILNIR
jgi:DNA mismatch repair ATPase MutS